MNSSSQQVIESEPQPALVSHTVAPVTLSRPELMRVLYEYAPTEPGHLTVQPGDLLYVLRKDPSGWWLASFDGQVGWIPHNFAKPVAKGRNSVAQA
jgi:signal transducing adaptor molecule